MHSFHRTCVLVALCSLASLNGYGQWFDWMFYSQDFDDTLRFNLSIDTADGHGGLWLIGAPQKTVFNAPINPPNVIVTDTVSPYPVNATSRFTITNLAQDGWLFPHTALLAGYYWADLGAGDHGTLEVSFDQGATWSDLINDPVVQSYLVGNPGPDLAASTNGWQYFGMNVANLRFYALNELGIQIDLNDSIQYRFSFISDSINDPHDGLMYDELYFEDYVETVMELPGSAFHVQVSPNPAADLLTIVYETNDVDGCELLVHDARGTLCLRSGELPPHRASLDVGALPMGLYSFTLRARNGKRAFGRFVKGE